MENYGGRMATAAAMVGVFFFALASKMYKSTDSYMNMGGRLRLGKFPILAADTLPIWGYFCLSNHNLILNSYGDTHHSSWTKKTRYHKYARVGVKVA